MIVHLCPTHGEMGRFSGTMPDIFCSCGLKARRRVEPDEVEETYTLPEVDDSEEE